MLHMYSILVVGMPDYYYKSIPVGTICNLLERGRLDINPSYHRQIVWTETRQKSLVDTLLRGFPIQPIYLSERGNVYECVDGKNRLRAIERYLKGELVVQGGVFSELSGDIRDDFMAINIQCCIFKEITDEDKREYFRRIQEGVSLNQTEIVWSHEERPIVSELRKIRKGVLDYIEVIWDTKRYSDMTLLCNISAMVIGKRLANHNTSLTTWIKNQCEIDGQMVKDIVVRIATLFTVQPHPKIKHLLVLDLARLLVHINLGWIDEHVLKQFITESNQYIIRGDEPTIEGVVKYASSIKQGTLKSMDTRYEIVKKLF